MKNVEKINPRICPLCRNTYTRPSALSRTDGKTYICPDCGTREALESMNVSKQEQEEIIRTIHRHTVV